MWVCEDVKRMCVGVCVCVCVGVCVYRCVEGVLWVVSPVFQECEYNTPYYHHTINTVWFCAVQMVQ